MTPLSVVPVAGMRDLLPRDVAQREYVINIVKHVFQLFGFQPIETPALERLSTLQGKYGEEGEQLMYKVLKRGQKLERALHGSDLADMGLRYDLTVPLARLVAGHQQECLPVFKRYQIQPVYRAERPAKGRYREFMQCDVDVVGLANLDAEAEVINAGAAVLEALGFSAPDAYRMRINHRSVLTGLLDTAQVPSALHTTALVAIDKADKIGAAGVEQELLRRGISADSIRSLSRFMAELSQATQPETVAASLEQYLAEHPEGLQGVADLRALARLLAEGPCQGRLWLDPFLARGMGYYTGPIYEIQFQDLASSGGGGGRYDELLGLFADKYIPACGFSLGLERILLIMAERDMFPGDLGQGPQVLVSQMDPSCAAYLHGVAHTLRQARIRTDLFPEAGSLRRQFRYAEKQGIRYVLIAGSDEVETDRVTIKDLETGAQVTIPRSETTAHLQLNLEMVQAQ